MYVSLMVLKAGSDGIADLNGFSENVLVVLNLSIFLVFLWASITLARKMGITVADTVLGYTKALALPALGLATGGLAMGAGAIMRQPKMKEWVQEGSKAVSQVPYVGAAMRPVMRKTAEMYAKDRKDVQDRVKQSEHLGADAKADIFRTYRSVTPLNEKDASAAALAALKDKDSAKLLTIAEKQRAIELSAKFDLHHDALERNPHLASPKYVRGTKTKEEAINDVVKRTSDRTDFTDESYLDKNVKMAIFKNIRGPKELQKFNRENPFAYDQIKTFYQDPANKAELDSMFSEMDKDPRAPGGGTIKRDMINNYFKASPSRALKGGRRGSSASGGTPPSSSGWAPPSPPPSTPPPPPTPPPTTPTTVPVAPAVTAAPAAPPVVPTAITPAQSQNLQQPNISSSNKAVGITKEEMEIVGLENFLKEHDLTFSVNSIENELRQTKMYITSLNDVLTRIVKTGDKKLTEEETAKDKLEKVGIKTFLEEHKLTSNPNVIKSEIHQSESYLKSLDRALKHVAKAAEKKSPS